MGGGGTLSSEEVPPTTPWDPFPRGQARIGLLARAVSVLACTSLHSLPADSRGTRCRLSGAGAQQGLASQGKGSPKPVDSASERSRPAVGFYPL